MKSGDKVRVTSECDLTHRIGDEGIVEAFDTNAVGRTCVCVKLTKQNAEFAMDYQHFYLEELEVI